LKKNAFRDAAGKKAISAKLLHFAPHRCQSAFEEGDAGGLPKGFQFRLRFLIPSQRFFSLPLSSINTAQFEIGHHHSFSQLETRRVGGAQFLRDGAVLLEGLVKTATFVCIK
jgi:hypothetical protein